MYYKLQELQGIEYIPASLFIPLLTLLRRYFFAVLQELYTNLTFSGTKRLLFLFSNSGGVTRVFSYSIFSFFLKSYYHGYNTIVWP